MLIKCSKSLCFLHKLEDGNKKYFLTIPNIGPISEASSVCNYITERFDKIYKDVI